MAERSESTRTEAGRGSRDLEGKAKNAARETREAAGEKKEEVKTQAREAGAELKDQAERVAHDQKDNVRGKAEILARALHAAGRTLEEDGEAEMGRFGHQAADQMERMAGYLERKDTAGLVRDLEGTARSNPSAFLASTLTAGLALGRFLRSSTPEQEGREQPHGRPGFAGETSSEGSGRYAASRQGSPAARRAEGGSAGTPADPGMTPRQPGFENTGTRTGGAGLASYSAGGRTPAERVHDEEEEHG